ncbi:hypothetical protein BC937DRAFT_88790 [Endogone sp. FLAS-F59071]|nr:hypothetical protein BC937DRAFT_88790 [Endogone sp. FLAS-F59071]|eukprot:RUS18420.1 hypothetical protein BC937DRAFT_88790 [Endogone sp. FLAS-F59071]
MTSRIPRDCIRKKQLQRSASRPRSFRNSNSHMMANNVSDQAQDVPTSLDRTNKTPPSIISPSSPHLSGSKAISIDLEEIQRKLEAVQKELAATRAELDITKQEAQTADITAAEDGRTNRRLRAEVQMLNDQLQRKDRQIEQTKATSFFFDGQLKKYEEEIDAARTGLERFQKLEEEAMDAQAAAEDAKKRVAEKYDSVRLEIDTVREGHRVEVNAIKAEIVEVQKAFLAESVETLNVATNSEGRVLRLLKDRGNVVNEVRAAHGNIVGRQHNLVELVEREVKRLREVMETEAEKATEYESMAHGIKDEMSDLIWKLRTFKVLQPSSTESA